MTFVYSNHLNVILHNNHLINLNGIVTAFSLQSLPHYCRALQSQYDILANKTFTGIQHDLHQ